MVYQLSEADRKKINADSEKSWLNYHQKLKHQCFKPGCESFAIGSHSISESISLSKISVNGNMKYFRSRRNGIESKELHLRNIGIDEASKFQGFCSKHDNEFEFLDKNECKYSVRQVLLQCYRSVCYAVYHCKYYAQVNDNSSFNLLRDFAMSPSGINFLTEDIKMLDEKLIENQEFLSLIRELLEEKITAMIESINYEYRIFSDLKETMELLLEAIEDKKLNSPINHIIKQRCSPFRFSFFYRKIKYKIPVAVVNHHLLKIDEVKTYLFFTVVPYEESTEIYWIFDDRYYDFFSEKWDEMNASEINILNRIESSMLQFEHWFIDSRILDIIPVDRINIIKEDINFNYDKNVFVDYDLSIFDELRLEFIRYVNETTRSIEQLKINANVKRKPREEREELYRKHIFN
jgi:hypothetical protein